MGNCSKNIHEILANMCKNLKGIFFKNNMHPKKGKKYAKNYIYVQYLEMCKKFQYLKLCKKYVNNILHLEICKNLQTICTNMQNMEIQ